MQFDPVWISTTEHLEKFYETYANSSILEKGLGIYKLPKDFPYAHMFWGLLPLLRVPIVAVANGIMKIESEQIHYQSKPMRIFGSRIWNLQSGLKFGIRVDELISIERYTGKSPISKYYNIPFIRVRSKQFGLAGDFLVCVGGTGPFMKKIKVKSNKLFHTLEQLVVE